jgi:sulfoxide reductase catalytic subunit YedY
MRPHRRPQLAPSDVTPRAAWESRRAFLRGAAAAGLGALLGSGAWAAAARGPGRLSPIPGVQPTDHGAGLVPTDYEAFTTYNNFVELAYDKKGPAKLGQLLETRPWTLRVEGECEAPGELGVEDILSRFPQQERIYRFRCVEGWSAVVPWVGLPLGSFLDRFKPTSRAKFVVFESILDPARLPGQRRQVLRWPYAEALRIDEAMHPLTLLATGYYGEVLAGQSGAPLRVVVPWKYGFKSAKSLVRMRFVERMPATTWNLAQPDEYGFYANVNPAVDHPRWSQRTERRLGEGLFARRHPTMMFNGYEEQVATLYTGMDLGRHY